MTAVVNFAARLVLTSATVTAVSAHDRFRTITLAGDGLRGASWVPGDKVRVRAGTGGFALRTYTPVSWDPARGETTLLAYVHSPTGGPGAAWCAGVAVGDACQFLGPQRSVRLDRLSASPVFVGDETSLGLLLATPASTACVLEAAAPSGVRSAMGDREASIVRYGELPDAAVAALRAHPDAPLLLTGRAQSIAAVRKAVKAAGLHDRETVAKAYWDEGRKGLD
jgi:ferric-chelate reductase (NADPH)